jgi:mono/diheme cytochrome c family protein
MELTMAMNRAQSPEVGTGPRQSAAGRSWHVVLAFSIALLTPAFGQQPTFRNAPASASTTKNPYAHSAAAAAAAGKKLYGQNCAQCHGKNLEGMGPAPALDSESVRNANPGELFWFITSGKPDSGMPSWGNLPKNQRWEIVSFLQEGKGAKEAAK